MENSYGVGIANRYELFLLDEEEDPLEVLKLQELEKENKKKLKQNEKGVKAPDKVKIPKAPKLIKETPIVKSASVDKPSPTANSSNDTNKARPNQRQAFDRKPRNPGDYRDERNNRRNRDDRLPHASGEFRGGYRPEGRYIPRDGPRDGPREDRSGLREGHREGNRYGQRDGLREGRGPRPDFGGGEDNRGRGGRGGFYRGRGSRGSYRGRGEYDYRAKREFGDSNLGKQDQARAQEAPAGNWEAAKPPAESGGITSSDPSDTAAPAEGDVENSTPVDLEPEELTLDEYKALRSSRQKPTFNLRKAGEGEDLTQWQTMYALTKNKVEEEEDDTEYDVLEYPQRVGRQKHLLDIDIRFADARRGGRGRGGRGGAYGGGFRNDGQRVYGGPNHHTDDGYRSSTRGTTGEYRGSGSRGYGGERGNRGHRGGERGGGHAEKYESRASKQNAPKVDDEHDFPSLG